MSSGQDARILVGVGTCPFSAGVVVIDRGKSAVLEDVRSTGAEMLIGMLGDGEAEMDDDMALESATEPP